MDYLVKEELQEIIYDYDSISKFIKKYKSLNYFEFDNYIVSKLSLFLVHESFNFEKLQDTIEKINKTMSSIVRIFEKPIIHLKEEDEILPVEVVKKINNETIIHASTHSELWDNITSSGVKPKKLLTKNYEDNFAIYENLVFVQTIDDILNYFRKNLLVLKNLMFASKNLEYNILERVNHLNYFLALGKLHTGYIRNFDQYATQSVKLNSQISYLYDSIVSRTKYKVYRKNKKLVNKRFPLKTTNIFAMQKDYHKVYLLAKELNAFKPQNHEILPKELKSFNDNYFYYSLILILFSLSHLDFQADNKTVIDFKNPNVTLSFKHWLINIKTVDINKSLKAIQIETLKQKSYKMLIFTEKISENEEKIDYEALLKDNKIPYDEIVYFSSLNKPENDPNNIYVSISDIDSFRRIQQIILRGMIYSDTQHRECPFCKGSLKEIESGDEKVYVCNSCNLEISKHTCLETNKKYFATKIHGYTISAFKDKHKWLFGNDNSQLMHYRNITGITEEAEYICPHCHKIH